MSPEGIGYKANPTLIKGGTGTGNILQARRSKMGSRAKRSRKRGKSTVGMMFGPAMLPKMLRR